MKKLSVALLTVMFALSFGSCSEAELDIPQEKLLKSFELNRDANGAYSIDYDVADNTSATTLRNVNSKTNEIHLSKGGNDAKPSYKNDFSLENDLLKVGFFDDNSGKNASITIVDENIIFAKGGDSGEFLKDYGVKSNGDGTYQLDFEVNNGVKTAFEYNKDIETYEVHLSRGNNISEKKFSRTLEMPDSNELRIDFVNNKNAGKGTVLEAERKPRIIIITD